MTTASTLKDILWDTVHLPNHSQSELRMIVLTIAMTAAPAPASAHTKRWKVKSSCKTQRRVVLAELGLCLFVVCLDIPSTFLCLFLPHWSHTSWRTSQILCTPSSPQRWSRLLTHLKHPITLAVYSLFARIQEKEEPGCPAAVLERTRMYLIKNIVTN